MELMHNSFSGNNIVANCGGGYIAPPPPTKSVKTRNYRVVVNNGDAPFSEGGVVC